MNVNKKKLSKSTIKNVKGERSSIIKEFQQVESFIA